jgi:ABC-2 type transport system ATP-binding protein
VAVIARGRIVACDAPGRIGNRADAQAIVSWREGDIDLTEATSEPTDFVRALAERFDGEIPALQVHRPTLEEIYLSLLKMEEER